MTHAPAEDTILIEDLDVECVIGLYEHERDIEQRVVVAAELTVDTLRAALTEELDHTVDYEWVAEQIYFILKFGRFQLLETAAHTICQALLLPPTKGEKRSVIEAVCLMLRKPTALRGRGLPTLKVRRRADSVTYRQESTDFGSIDVFYDSNHLRLYRVNVAPSREFRLSYLDQSERACFVLSTGLYSMGAPVGRFTIRQWPETQAPQYDNPTQAVQSLLCIERTL